MKRILLIILILMCITGCSQDSVNDKGDSYTETDNGSSKDDNGSKADDDRKTVTDGAEKSVTNDAEESVTEVNNTDIAADSVIADPVQTERYIRLQKSSEELAIEMANGDFENTYKKLDSAVAKNFTMKNLKQAWDDTVAILGKYISLHTSSYTVIDGYLVVDVVLEYEYKGMNVRLTYGANDKLAGIFFSYTAIEEELTVTENYEEIKISIDEGKYPLTGILTLPTNINKPPVAILVPGSGSNDADETIGANKFFRDLARSLAEKGIASIRYNERALMYPEISSEEGVNIQTDCLKDAADAIDYAYNSKELDKSRITVIGHSLGGMMAAKIASDNPQVSAIVILAGSPRKLEDIWYDQMVAEIKMNGGYTKGDLKLTMNDLTQFVMQVKNLEKDGPEMLLLGPASYWYSLNQINIPELAIKLTIPMFIAQGSEDFQVFADKDYTEWQLLLKNKPNVSFKLYENLNHLFMKTNGKKDMEEYMIPGEIDRQFIDDLSAWILNN